MNMFLLCFFGEREYNIQVMKKEVTLRISSKQYAETLEPSGEAYKRALELEDSLEIITDGTLYSKKNATYIAYDESEEAGLQNSRTLLKLGDGRLQIIRYGDSEEENMDMTLEKGVMNIVQIRVPMVACYELEVYTNSLEGQIDEDGNGSINVDYRIKFDKFFTRRTKLDIDVRAN